MSDSLSTARKTWDSEFFRREIHELTAGVAVQEQALREAVEKLDARGVWGIEAPLPTSRMAAAPVLEACGFRLVDSKMTFMSRMSREQVSEAVVPFGQLRLVRRDDLPRIRDLTTEHLVDNPAVYSRFKNPHLFTHDESVRYYEAWAHLTFDRHPDLFVVWEVDDQVVAFFNYMRVDDPQADLPVFKGILTAVDTPFRGHGAQNLMQSFLYPRLGEPEWLLDNTTQISNAAVIRNHMRAGKTFQGSTLVFYRTRGDAPS